MLSLRSYIMMGTLGMVALQQASGIVLSYYRFEVDNDPGIGLITPDELSGFNLIAAEATVDDSANPGSLPPLFEPGDGSANLASLDGLEPNVDAKAAYNSVLDVDALTVEFYARTEESTAVMVGRSTTDIVNASVEIQDGFRIYDTQALKVDFWTYDGTAGTQTMHTISTSFGMDLDGTANASAEWRHVAFTYEDGIANFYLDAEVIGTVTVDTDEILYWGDGSSGAELFVGVEMDGYDFSKTEDDNGFLDELRFSQGALDVDDLLPSVPEPKAYALLVGLVVFFKVGLRRRRRVL